MAFNIFATATSDIPLANLDANFTLIGAAAAVSTLYPTATTSITYGTAGTTHNFSGSGIAVTGLVDISAATSGQIKFPATQNASANANTLDDYEEGTWTPAGVLGTPGTSASSDIAGTYTKVGRIVTVATNFTFTKGTGTGNFSVSGLPYTIGSALVYTAVTVQCENVGSPLNVVVAYASPNGTTVQFILIPQSTGAANVLTDTALGTTAAIRFSLTYAT